jgi:hypothetical protein
MVNNIKHYLYDLLSSIRETLDCIVTIEFSKHLNATIRTGYAKVPKIDKQARKLEQVFPKMMYVHCVNYVGEVVTAEESKRGRQVNKFYHSWWLYFLIWLNRDKCNAALWFPHL